MEVNCTNAESCLLGLSTYLLGLSTFRGKSYCICSVFLFYFPAKKKIFVSNLIEKLFSLSCNTFQEMLTYHPP
jgi:hypothetical protein